VVARHDLEPGDALRDVEVRLLPAALVPDGALERPAGQVVTAWIAAGEIVVRERVTPDGLSATAARLPPGTRGVAVPQGVAPLPVEVGDHVDLIATLDTTSVTVASGAIVIAVADDAVTVAVERVDAPRVAHAVNAAAVTLVLSGAR
jgi:Flp pilus assembly protein CpaB